MKYEGEPILNLLKEIKVLIDKCVKAKMNMGSYTIPQTMIIHNLAQNGSMKISELSTKMGLTNSTVSGIVDRLEDQGVVERKRSTSDRRVVHVDLTSEHKQLNQNTNNLDLYFDEVFKELSEQEVESIFHSLHKLKETLDNHLAKESKK